MISLKVLSNPPKDGDLMISRKSNTKPFRVEGIVVNKKSGKSYNIAILSDKEQLEMDSQVKVSCSCHDFKFRWAYVLFKQDALLNPREYVLEPPKVTNPEGNVKACKHIHKFISDEVDRSLKTFSSRKGKL